MIFSITTQPTNSSAILVGARVHNNRANLVIILQRLAQRLENKTSSTFTARKSRIGAMIKGKCFALVIKNPANRGQSVNVFFFFVIL